MRETKIESFPDKNLGKRLNVWELKQICKKREVMGRRGGEKVWGNSYILKKGLKLFLFGILTIILPTGELELRPGWGSCGAL